MIHTLPPSLSDSRKIKDNISILDFYSLVTNISYGNRTTTTDSWNCHDNVSTNITKLYSLEADETLSDEEIQKAQKDILLDIKEEDTKLNKGLQTIQEGVLQRVESYSRTIAK